MRLGDPTSGLKETALEDVALGGDRLSDYAAFWERSAATDAIVAIADATDETTFEASGRVDAEAILELAPARATVLEIGCGIGRVLSHLSDRCAEVHGVDISAEMVEKGRARLAHLPNVHFHHGNGYDLGNFEDGTFDLVFTAFVLQHMPKTIAFNYMTEAARVLKPGGTFRVQVPNILRQEHFDSFRHFSQPYFLDHPYPMNFYSPPELVQMLGKAGFGVRSIDDYMVAVAVKGAAHDPSLLGGGSDALLRARVEDLEREVASMRKVYDHPAVQAALRMRRRLRRS